MTEPELEPSSLTQTVVRGVGLAGAGYVLAQFLTLGFYFALARLASPADFGDFAAGALLVSVGLLFTESGMMAALIHREDRIDEAASTATVATAVAGLGFGLVALAAAPLVGTFFGSSRIGEVAAACSGLLFLRSLLVVPEALLQRRFSFLRRMIIEPVGVIAFGAGAVIATANGLGVWGLVIGYYCSAVVDVLLSWALVGWRPRLRQASMQMWRELIRYGRYVVATTALLRVGEQVPIALLGRFVGISPLGQYRYADRMISTPSAVVVQGASYVLFPALARIRGESERFRAASMRSLRLMCIVGFPLGLILVPLGVPAAVLLFGEVWRDAGYAAMALAAVPAAVTLGSFASEAFKAWGRPEILTKVHVINLIALVAFMVALLPFDLYGIAAGISAGTVIGAAYGLHQVAKMIDISLAEIWHETWAQATAAVLMAALLIPVELLVDAEAHGTATGLALLSAEALLGVAAYIALLRLISPQVVSDARSAASSLRRSEPTEMAEAGAPSPDSLPTEGAR